MAPVHPDAFKIYTEQLHSGKTQAVHEVVSSDFLDVNDESLHYVDSVKIDGEVYLADDDLILHFQLVAYAMIPCSICNEPVKVEVEIENFYHAESLSAIKTGIFNFKEIIREAILLDTPLFAECDEGECKKRKEIQKYLKDSTKPSQGGSGDEGYHPFADL